MVVLQVEALGHGPMPTDSPFLFAVHHLDRYPPGNANLGPSASLRGHNMGADFGHPDGWSMYHGETVPGFPKHPHRGFETITVAKQGYIDHTDSLGNGGRFGGGDVQWMTAGAGISHAEMFPLLDPRAENVCELFQIWLNLPRRSKGAPPTFKMLWAEEIPKQTVPAEGGTGSVALTLYVGRFGEMAPPPPPPGHSNAAEAEAAVVVLSTPPRRLNPRLGSGDRAWRAAHAFGPASRHTAITLSAGAAWRLPAAAAGLHRSVYLYAGGRATIGAKEVEGRKKVKVEAAAEVPIVNRGGAALELLLLQGKDIGEPVVQHGPFVGNTRQDIMQAFQDYQATGFGEWPWPSDAHAFPRERQRFAQYADGKVDERPMVAGKEEL